MALKRNDDGTFVIRSRDELVRALTMMCELEQEIRELHREHGIDEMLVDSTELKKAATKYCAEKQVEKVELKKVGKVAKLVRSVGSRKWIGTKDDLNGENAQPLRSLVSKEVWMKITKRVPDPELIQQAVEEGTVVLAKISPAYVETYRSPYLRLVDEATDEDEG